MRYVVAIDRAAARWTAALCGLVTVDTRTVEDGDTRGCTRSILRVESGYEWVTLLHDGCVDRRACITSLCEAVMIDGVMVAQVSERAECGAGVCAWAPPVAAREDDLGEIELGPEPPRKP